MNVRAAWSADEQDTLIFTDLHNGFVEVKHHHIDMFDAEEDSSVTVGEFTPADLERALIEPRPATTHVANKRPTLLQRLLWRGKDRA